MDRRHVLLTFAMACSSAQREENLAAQPVPSAPTHATASPQTLPVAPVLDASEVSARLASEPIDWEQNAVMRSIRRMTARMKETHYVHGIDVHVKRGIFGFDCSGMVDWILRGATPLARSSLQRGLAARPLARDFVEHLSKIQPGEQRGGWLRVGRVEDARPGDVIAWLKPKIVHSTNTGHVGIVVLRPRRRIDGDTAHLVRIADASRLTHDFDSRKGYDGYGLGNILVETDPVTQAPSGIHFGGSRARFALGTKVVIGRPLN